MSNPVPGPYRIIETAGGDKAAWYALPFDKSGRCVAPRTRDDLITTVAEESPTDVFVFSHGWNNDWETATDRYRSFISGFTAMRRDHDLEVGRPYHPLLIGIIWPSTALVMPWEATPQFAAGAGKAATAPSRLANEQVMISEIAGDLAAENVPRFYQLIDQPEGLDDAGAAELAGLLLDLSSNADELTPGGDLAASELVNAWKQALPSMPLERAAPPTYDDNGYGTVDGPSTDVQVAGFLDRLDPREIIRLTTVLQMKDRAGVVGAAGVSSLLADLLAGTDARVHMIGHSYGAKVVLTALAVGEHPRPVSSVLLLQPAVSRYCFASDLGEGRSGGFRICLDRSKLPIMSTFSRRDLPLTRFFHLAVRRKSDIGEVRVAAAGQSRYAALGGFGPGELARHEVDEVAMKPVGESYGLASNGKEVLALQGHEAIRGHGDVSNPHTWWALYNAVVAS